MTTFTTCSNLAEAELIKSMLEGNGILAVIPNANTPQPLSGFPSGYPLQVAPEDEARARELLAEVVTPEAPTAPPAALAVNPPGTGFFQAAIMADMATTTIFWMRSLHGRPSHPAHIEEYLASLAPSVAAWHVGYLCYQILVAISFLSGLLMLFRVRTGWTLYTLTAVLYVNLLWVFPAGIGFGGWNVLGSVQMLLAGGIITFGFTHRHEVFGYSAPAQPSP